MNKFLIASHGDLANGIKSTIELFAGKSPSISYISAYTNTNNDLETQLNVFFSTITESDTVIVFTDLYGGSVNQKISEMVTGRKNIYIIAGFNLPVILETVLHQGPITPIFIDGVIKKVVKI